MKNLELRIKNLPSAELQKNWKLKIENWKLAFGRITKKLKIENWKLAFDRISKIILYSVQEIPPPLGGRLGGGLKNNEEFRI